MSRTAVRVSTTGLPSMSSACFRRVQYGARRRVLSRCSDVLGTTSRSGLGADHQIAPPLEPDRLQDPHGAGGADEPLVALHVVREYARPDDLADPLSRRSLRTRVRPA